jgi:hypothetical protein
VGGAEAVRSRHKIVVGGEEGGEVAGGDAEVASGF